MIDFFSFLISQFTFTYHLFANGHIIYGLLATGTIIMGYAWAGLAIDSAFRNSINRGFYVVAPILVVLIVATVALLGASMETVKYTAFSMTFMFTIMAIAAYPCIQQAKKFRYIKLAAYKVNAPKPAYENACFKASFSSLLHPFCLILYLRSASQYTQNKETFKENSKKSELCSNNNPVNHLLTEDTDYMMFPDDYDNILNWEIK